jgi:hypothetical protein
LNSSEDKSGIDIVLSRFLVFSQILSILAVPIVLAYVGFLVQGSLQEQQVKRDYVNLAVSLLTPKKDGEKETSKELRDWAISLLNESSPIKLSPEQVKSLQENGLRTHLKAGDLLFFETRVKKSTGIYLGNKQIIRTASEGKHNVEVQKIDASGVEDFESEDK